MAFLSVRAQSGIMASIEADQPTWAPIPNSHETTPIPTERRLMHVDSSRKRTNFWLSTQAIESIYLAEKVEKTNERNWIQQQVNGRWSAHVRNSPFIAGDPASTLSNVCRSTLAHFGGEQRTLYGPSSPADSSVVCA